MGAIGFFERIFKELQQNIYIALGGSLEDQTLDWTQRGLHFADIAIKILILLAFIGFWYWLLVYVTKHSKRLFRLSDRHIRIIRSVLRYVWLVVSVLAVMTQIGIATTTIKAVAKASAWAGFYYVLWAMSGQTVRWLLRQYDINESIEQLCKNLLSVMIFVLAAAAILAQFGFDIVSLVAGLGIVGLAVGFAAQSTLANFIAGVTILVEQSFGVGDWIAVGSQEGKVVKITLRTTHILTRSNTTVIFPNSTVASTEVVNLTAKSFIRFEVMTRIGLNADIDTARSAILSALKQNNSVLAHPLPSVNVSKIGEYDLPLVVRFWLSPQSVARLPVIKELVLEDIKKAFDNAQIDIPYPHMNLVKDEYEPQTSIIYERDNL